MTLIEDADASMVFLSEQQEACRMALRVAYQRYFGAVAGHIPDNPEAINRTEIEPLEAEYQRLDASIVAYFGPHAPREVTEE